MKAKIALMIVTLILCAMAAQAQNTSIKWTPSVPEVGVCLVVTGTATSGNGVAAGVPFAIEGDTNGSGVTDYRGHFLARVKPVPDVSHIQFGVRIGNGSLSDYIINVAKGWWGDESTVSGGFTASYSVSGLGGCPGVSWSSTTNGTAHTNPEHKTLKGSVSYPVTGGSARCTVSASAISASAGYEMDCAASITGGVSSTEIKKFVFHPTTVHKHVPSMSVVHRQGSISVSCSTAIGNMGLPQQGSASAAATAASSYVPAVALTASGDGPPPAPISIIKDMPPLMMSGGTFTVPMSRAVSTQAKFDLGEDESAVWLTASGSGESTDSATRTAYSAE